VKKHAKESASYVVKKKGAKESTSFVVKKNVKGTSYVLKKKNVVWNVCTLQGELTHKRKKINDGVVS
tara:strand:- start:104 stop:304 length:201 start_codon:yes stop_codon:yes gene_type:complete